MTKSEEQFNRTLRWYEIFKEINDGKLHDRSSDFYQDSIYSFFQNCHHLKDWVANDIGNSLLKNDLNNFINNHDELKIAGALCNGSKHLKITSPCFDKNTKIGGKNIKVGIGGGDGPVSISIKFTINTSSGKFDAFEIATKCIELWREFFDLNKLWDFRVSQQNNEMSFRPSEKIFM